MADCGCSKGGLPTAPAMPDEPQAILDAGLEVADLREGERSIDAAVERRVPRSPELPAEYDFRMVPTTP